ncbi:MAG TPA: histidine phosphatase family protein [Dehalococcoidia bacterium]|nr:histidine phosphatase family protein [Dehalococcoidia bacterium]
MRHGETTWNASRRYQGQSESDLSPEGRDEAAAVGRRLASIPLSGAFASDLRRTVHTAEIILADRPEVPLRASPHLRELHFGDFEGLTLDQIRSTYPDAYQAWADDLVDQAPPGGETLREQVARAATFLTEEFPPEIGGRYLIVGHGGSIRALLFTTLGVDLGLYWRVAIANASITSLERRDGRWRLCRLNDVCHLRDLNRYQGGIGASYGIRLPK